MIEDGFNLADRIGEIDILWITLDSLRFDVAQHAFSQGKLKTLQKFLPNTGWQKCHSPGSFTYATHHALFSGFFPTPASPGLHPRRFASRFPGSETTKSTTFVFDESTVPEALSQRGYRTCCVGGTGFFNPETTLGNTFPSMFQECHWTKDTSVVGRQSEVYQVSAAIDFLEKHTNHSTYLFINFAAIHQPNWFYDCNKTDPNTPDDLESHFWALVAIDTAMQPLFQFYKNANKKLYCMICSDHGTAYGEDGFNGHRSAHSTVMTVPFTEFLL